MELWKKIAWTPEQEQIIYREWGRFYTKKNKMDLADFFYNKSLELDPKDPKALYSRSQCKRSIAQTEGALADAKRALELDELRQPFNLEVCDAIYQLNEFERAKYTLTNYSRKFKGMKKIAFKNRVFVVNENFKSSLGTELGYFILENGKYFDKAYRKMQRERSIDPRPLWKILKESKKCDTLSILEIEKEAISPREIARRERSFRIFNQIYFGRNWIDVLFLKALQTDKNLLLPQSQLTRPMLENLTGSKYEVVQKMIKMLHARSPLYAETVRNCSDRSMKVKHRDDYLFRVQYRVHRNMLHMLKTMRCLRQQKRVQKLRKYVEEIMGDYVVLKTNRLMPWKFQFINEVYNLLGLALCDHFLHIPQNLTDIPRKARLIAVLKLKTDMDKDPVSYEFGKRHTFQDPDADDKNLIQQKALVERLTQRLKFAKYSIEKAYLWHEIATSEFKQNSFDACCLFAERCIAEATKCNSFVWMLHGTMMICKAHAQLQKVEKVMANLRDAKVIAKSLKSSEIMEFLDLCFNLSRKEIFYKKITENVRSKSKQSLRESIRDSINRSVLEL